MPYLIPEPAKNPLIDEIPIRGFCVYLPDDIGFLTAFIGAYQFFTKWVAYEKDDSKSASRAAHMFQVAYDKTLETFWSEGCGDGMAEPCVVNVVNNNYVTCGSCGTPPVTLYCVNEDGDTIVNPPPVTDDPIEPIVTLPPEDIMPPVGDPAIDPPPDGWTDWESFDAGACDAANTLVAWAIEASQRCCEFFTQDVYGITAIFAFVVNMYFGSWQIVLSGAFFLKLAELLRAVWDNTESLVDMFCGLNDYIVENRQELVCMLYENRQNAADWENQLVSVLFQASEGGLVSLNSKPLWLDTLKYLLPGLSSVGVLLGSVAYKGSKAGFLDCGECENIPPTSEDWVIIPVTESYYAEPSIFTRIENLVLTGTDVSFDRVVTDWHSELYMGIMHEQLKTALGYTGKETVGLILACSSDVNPDGAEPRFNNVMGTTDIAILPGERHLVIINEVPSKIESLKSPEMLAWVDSVTEGPFAEKKLHVFVTAGPDVHYSAHVAAYIVVWL